MQLGYAFINLPKVNCGVVARVGTGLPEAFTVSGLGNLARKAIRARPRPLGRAFGQFVGESKISMLIRFVHSFLLDQIDQDLACL